MKYFLTAMLIWMQPWVLLSQDDQVQSFEVQISTDTILFGNYLEIRFTAQNIQGTFEPPRFEHFDVLSGPNESSSIRIFNGQTSQTTSFSYFIQPKKTGPLYIEPAYYSKSGDDNKLFETLSIEIISLPNPDGVVQESRIENDDLRLNFGTFPFFQEAPSASKKKKLKVTKI